MKLNVRKIKCKIEVKTTSLLQPVIELSERLARRQRSRRPYRRLDRIEAAAMIKQVVYQPTAS